MIVDCDQVGDRVSNGQFEFPFGGDDLLNIQYGSFSQLAAARLL